jgi:exodeoxyribonuclease-1
MVHWWQMSEQTFFWYDLETTGINPRQDRIMQFAGQRTTLDLKPVGDPVNVLVRLSEDVLPSPDAILVTGITPQATQAEGITEAEFIKLFQTSVALPGTIFAGYNTVRFDDEFMRYTHYRNFADAYAWQWQEDRSRWDLLDVIRMTRALRPQGIQWPVVDGKPTNRLELLTKVNAIDHVTAHDALSDVTACIAVARLVQQKQPKLFDWLFTYRDKKKVAALVGGGKPLVYSSGKYDNEFEKTSVVVQLAPHPKKTGALVYDLRHNPTEFIDLSAEQLAERWRWTRQPDAAKRLPIKTMQFNRCPAVAPLTVLDAGSQQRLQLDPSSITANYAMLQANSSFKTRVLEALALLDAEQAAHQQATRPASSVDEQLYDGFFDTHDGVLLDVVRAAEPHELTASFADDFHDGRLKALLPLYKARNYPSHLTPDERTAWEAHRYHAYMDGGVDSKLSRYMHRLQELAAEKSDDNTRYLLQELQLYAESTLPLTDNDLA